MTNEIQIFNNPEFGAIRTIELDGEPLFVGKDIAEALGYTNPQKAVRDHVDDEDKTVNDSFSVNGTNLVLIRESGVYALVFGSKLDSAKRFKRWVTSEVLPSIRKTGGYNLPQTYAEALRALADKAEEAERLALKVEEDRPKVEFFNAVTDSKDAISLGEVAKVLDMGVGRNKLFDFLRTEKILDNGNIPYQRYIDAGYFRTIEQKYTKGDETKISIKTLVFQKGVDFIRKRLLAYAKDECKQN